MSLYKLHQDIIKEREHKEIYVGKVDNRLGKAILLKLRHDVNEKSGLLSMLIFKNF